MSLTLGSLFSGSGGFELAGVMCGIKPIWASEIEPFCIRVTEKNFPGLIHLGDIKKLNGAEIPPVDIITGGSPCTNLSTAGRHEGLQGAQSSLFYEQIRVVKEMRDHEQTIGRTGSNVRCRWMVWENVPGAFSSNKGTDFQTVLTEIIRIAEPKAPAVSMPANGWPNAGCFMADDGDWSVAYRVLDAQYWGVPQRRRRIFLVADFAEDSAGKILFEREGLSGDFAESRRAWQGTEPDPKSSLGETGGCLTAYPLDNNATDSRIDIKYDGVSNTITRRMGTGGNQGPMVLVLDNQGVCS